MHAGNRRRHRRWPRAVAVRCLVVAPLPNIADTYRVALNWDFNNQCNVLHVHAPSSTPNVVATSIDASVTKEMWGITTTGVHVFAVDVTPLDNQTATYRFVTGSPAKWGGKATGDIIPGSAAVLSEHTLFRGPANRGRMYLGPVAESFQSNGLLITGNVTELVSAWTAFGVAMVAHSMQHVVASYKHATALTVVSYSVRQAMGTQRKRQSRLAA